MFILRLLKKKTAVNLETESKCIENENRFDVIIIGHFSLDKNIWPTGQIKNTLGGAPTYSGSIFAALGKKTGIFTIIGKDHFSEALSFCQSKNIDTLGLLVSTEQTMAFQNSYTTDGSRRQKCLHVAPKLLIRNLPKNYLDSKAFYISPLAGEVDEELLRKLKKKENVLMLDPQGLMRNISKNGEVKVVFDKNKLERIFKLVDIVKIGKDEVKAFKMQEKEILNTLDRVGVKIAIITRGKDPIMILHSGRFFEVQTLDTEVKDPTGAGDVFGAAFLSEYMTGSGVEKAAKFAAAAASLKIRYKGPNGFPSKKDIIRHLLLNTGKPL